jgi:hypothetical protein
LNRFSAVKSGSDGNGVQTSETLRLIWADSVKLRSSEEVNKQRSFEGQALYIKNILALPQRTAHCRDRMLIV